MTSKKIPIFIFWISLLLTNISIAQVNKLDRVANNYFKVEEFASALPLYLKLDSLVPENALYQYRTGICYYNSHYKNKSLAYFEKARNMKHEDPELDMYLARACHYGHKFDEAIIYYEKFKRRRVDTTAIEEKEDDTEDIKEVHFAEKHIDRYIQMCRTGKELVEDSLYLVMENIGPTINTIYPDYVPVISADESVLIFTSRRNTTTGGKIDNTDNHFYEDVYISHKDSITGKWRNPENMGTHVNSALHDACIGLSPDGQKLFIYRSNSARNSSGDIYISRLEGTNWSVPVLMDKNINSPGWEPSATISADEKTIYFTSNRPGGYGGTDIYMIKLIGDTLWSEPINMGPIVNTEFNEDAPYIHPDNVTLFFSSKGHKNIGGYDIFTTVYDVASGQWSKPENAGYPINTADDDIYFIWSADGTKGYFSSWRDNTYGEKDIYVIHRPEGKASLLVMKGRVLDNITKKPLSASMTVIDKQTGVIIGKFNSNSTNGKYVLTLPHGGDYSVTVETDGYITNKEDIKVPRKNPFFEVRKDFYLDQLQVGVVLVFNNIFFDFDKAVLRKDSDEDLKKILDFLIQYSDFKVEISGHTDSKGNERYNQKLSERRGAAVVKYMIQNGIPKERMVAKGYGEKKPLAPNETDEGRQMNRRTELKILDTSYTPIERLKDISISYRNEYGTLDRSGGDKKAQRKKRRTKNNQIKHISDYDQMMANQPKAGELLSPKVHFVQNMSGSLTEYSLMRIAEVVDLMKKYPALKIKVMAYGDYSGNLSYNKAISKQRAETVYKLILNGGVAKERLQMESFKENTNRQNETAETVDLKNRRVEFVVIE
jgi:outer membrane protein OmpA-like peptidoglycan-associated protein/tetratricopeptide (TPR) repeat protein